MVKSFSRCISLVRWKLYKLSMRLSLGRTWGWGLDRNLIYSIPEACVSEDVARHVVDIRQISDAYVQKYRIPSTQKAESGQVRVWFGDAKPVPKRNLYVLSEVAVSPETGAVWVPDTCAFVESLGNNVHLYAWGGLIDMMRKPSHISAGIVTPCANLGYYHWLLDAMGQVLIARRELGRRVKVLVSRNPFRFVKDGLQYFGIEDEDVVYVDGPVVVDRAILVARNNDLGVVFNDNIEVLRNEIAKHFDENAPACRKIYISRRLERNRAIRNEGALEDAVRTMGFEVCYFEKMPFAEQIKTVREARIVMGIHGAGLSNIIAGRKGLKVIELLNPTWFNTCFAQLASQLGFDYHYMMLRLENSAVYADIEEVKNLICSVLAQEGTRV